MLRQHVEPARARRVAVQLAAPRRRAIAASHSSTSKRLAGTRIARAGLVHAVVGAADALQQARDALRRADLDHLVDAAPVDAEIERGGRDHGAQLARRHRRLDPAALGDVEAAVVQRDRQRLGVQPPQRLEQQLALRAGVDEHDGHAGGADALQDLAAPRSGPCGRTRAAARRAASSTSAGGAPSATSISRRRRRRADIGAAAPAGARRSPTARPGARPAPGSASRARPSASWSPRLVPASACTSSITTARSAGEQRGGVGQREQQRQAFRRGQQDVAAAARAGGARRSAGVSPVRVSIATGRPISADRRGRLRAMSVASAFSGLT